MPRRALIALGAAASAALALLVVWYGAHDVPTLRSVDASVLAGFESLHRPWLDRLSLAIAQLCNPMPYVLLAAVPVAVALVRRRVVGWRLAIVVALVLLGANETTEVLKPLLAGAHDPVAGVTPSDVSYPSGHATASMSLALVAVLAASPRRRPLVATAMAGFVVAVCWSFLEQGWHYPSDVLGGFLVASLWTLLGIAALSLLAVHLPRGSRQLRRSSGAGARPSLAESLGPPAAALALIVTFLAGLVLARPHTSLDFVRAHELFVLGAATIAGLSFGLAGSLSVVLRRTRLDDGALRPPQR